MSDVKFERFGKYLILDHLVDGGMAKICRARFLGEQANKLVAVKMVQPQFSKDANFVKMFEDELKVTFGLLHPNIVQIYDYGIEDQQLYQAMEYIDGKNLKEYLDRLKAKNFVFPVEISIYIISQVAQALHYAHTFADKMTGKKLNIVHRDISPHNIMLTFDGSVKVIDFGIAKADSNSEATQAGTIKGKLSYLAPEYLDGLALDPRYDEFAVGITLWEMLCSRKLFTAKNDLAVLKQIQACKVPPPSSINPNVPKELDTIVLKALSKDRNQRYEDMDKFNRALVKFLYSNYPDFNATDLNYFSKQLFKEEITKNQKLFVEFGQIDISPYLKELANNTKSSKPVAATSAVLGESRTGKIELDLKVSSADSSGLHLDKLEKLGKSAGTASGVNVKPAAGAPGARTGGASGTGTTPVNTRTKKPDKTETRSVKNAVTTKGGKIQETKSSGGMIKFAVASVVGFAVLSFMQPQMVYKMTGMDIGALMGKPAASAASASRAVSNDGTVTKVAAAAKMGTINLMGYDSSLDVYLNGKKVAMSGIDLEVPLNKKVRLEIKKLGFKTHMHEMVVTEDRQVVNFKVPELEKVRVGLLSTSNNYTAGSVLKVMVDGSEIEKGLPLNNERFPAGSYDAVIMNPLLGTEKKINFKIDENKKTFID